MLLYICIKFHENISNGFWVTERTRFCDRCTDDQGKNKMSPNTTGGDIIVRKAFYGSKHLTNLPESKVKDVRIISLAYANSLFKNIFSLPVRSTRRAIAIIPVFRVRVLVTLRQSFIFKFSKSSYLDSHSSESIHIWTIGTLEGRLSFHIAWPQG